MAVTQKQIAEKLNISRSLVGHALNGGSEVSAVMRERILAAAGEMGYDVSSNREARALIAQRYGKRLRRGVIAVVFSLIDDSSNVHTSLRSSPYFMPVIDGMEEEAAARGFDLCLCPIRTQEVPRLVREKSVDGVIMLTDIQIIRELDVPKVYFHAHSRAAASVSPDDRDGARQATRHLLELGHRRIAFLGVRHTPGVPGEQRLLGYRDAMCEYGIEVQDEWVETDLQWPNCMPTADEPGCGHCASCIGWKQLVAKNKGWSAGQSSPFTGLVCYNDPVAMGAIIQARKEGIEVPRDLSVVGFDDVSSQHQFQPALTSVQLPLQEMGRVAVRLLKETIDAEVEPERQYPEITLPVSLIVRKSTVSFS